MLNPRCSNCNQTLRWKWAGNSGDKKKIGIKCIFCLGNQKQIHLIMEGLRIGG